MNYKYREIIETDIDSIFKIRISTRENKVTMRDLEKLGITPESTREALKEEIKGWVCLDLNKPVGFSSGNIKTGEVIVLAVLPEYEGKGIGKNLVQKVQNWLFEQGHEQLFLFANYDSNVRAHGFYRKIGWQPTGEKTGNEEKLILLKQ